MPSTPRTSSASSNLLDELAAREQWATICSKVGRRYTTCRFEKYQTSSPAQARALAAVQAFGESILEHVQNGDGLIIFGPVGTGKDHLLTAMLHRACKVGLSVDWLNGQEFFADLRDSIDRDEREATTLRRLAKPEVLAISDPLPPSGKLTEFQQNWMFRFIDRRYRDQRSTFVTLNAADRTEAIDRLGPAIVDRLVDGALALHCNWNSHRALQTKAASDVA
jgi:DNA replication protein DnaC